MKKIITIVLLATAVATSSMAAGKSSTSEKRYGLGADIIGGNDMLRVSVDGLVKDVRIEGRMGYTRTTSAGTTTSGLAFGIAGYYNLSEYIAVGGHLDSTDTSYTNDTRFAAALKVEKEVMKNVALGAEFGYLNRSINGGNTTFSQYSLITVRAFF